MAIIYRSIISNSRSIFLTLVLLFSFSACHLSYTATGLVRKSSANEWRVSFDSFDGELTRRFDVNNGKPSTLIVDSNIASGTLLLQATQHDLGVDISLGHQEIDISEWSVSNYIVLSMVGTSAQNGSVVFSWK